MSEWHTLTRSPEQTELIGAALSAALPSLASGPAVVYLAGDLGAGKTTLARGFLHHRGITALVQSPTFTLLECYELKGLVVVHVDLYRLRAAEEVETLGLRDLARPEHVWLVEWPERGTGHLAAPDLRVGLRVATAGHSLELAAHTPLGRTWLAGAVAVSRSST